MQLTAHRKAGLAAPAILALATIVAPAPAMGPPTMEDAQALHEAGRWEEAADAWRHVVEEEPDNATAWFNLGYSLHAGGRLDEAIEAHRKAASFDRYRGIALYNLGCAYALADQSDEALEALAASQAAGFAVRRNAEHDSDLHSLRGDPRFETLMASEAAGFKARVQQALGRFQQALARQGPGFKQMLAGLAQHGQQLLAQWQQKLAGSERWAPLAAYVQRVLGGGGGPQNLADADAPAQDRPAPSLDEARRLQQSRKWHEAAAAYAVVTEAQPDNPGAWFGLAYCLHMDGDYDKAIAALRKAATFEQLRGIATYNLACAYALSGRTDEAFDALEEARAVGFDLKSQITSDGDLDSLRDDPRFQRLVAELKVEL